MWCLFELTIHRHNPLLIIYRKQILFPCKCLKVVILLN